jgi:DNA-binding protein HU-beta
MNKGELIEAVAAELGDSKTAAAKAVEAVIASIATGIKRDSNVSITGFGTFSRKKRAPRTGRNPATGLPIEIKESTTVGFRPSPALKSEI